jgi:hypothetical protein
LESHEKRLQAVSRKGKFIPEEKIPLPVRSKAPIRLERLKKIPKGKALIGTQEELEISPGALHVLVGCLKKLQQPQLSPSNVDSQPKKMNPSAPRHQMGIPKT